MIDLAQAERYIELLTGSPTSPLVFQVFDDSKIRKDPKLSRVLIGTVQQHANMLSKMNDNGCGIFVQINEGLKRGAKGVTAPRVSFADDDNTPLSLWLKRQSQGKAQPCSRCGEWHCSELAPLIALQPTMIVQSSEDERNRHYYWRLVPGANLILWSETQAQLACALKTDPLINVDRVMRLPGSMNRKVDPERGRDGTPFRVRLVEEAPSTIYSLNDVRAAFPDPGTKAASLNIIIDLNKGISGPDAPLVMGADELPPLEGLDEEATPAGKRSIDRIRGWLTRMQVDYDRKKNHVEPGLFRLRRCVFNPDHVNSMAIIVVPSTGALFAGCFHESCQSNAQRWDEVKDKIGGWDQLDPTAFRNGSQAEMAIRVLSDLAVGSTETIIFAEGAFRRYSPLSGIWGVVDGATISRILQSYDGRKIGKGGKKLIVDRRHVSGAISLAGDRAARPDFFFERTPGLAFSNGFVRVDEAGVSLEPFSPSHRAQASLGFPYDPLSAAPRFAQFLSEVFAPDADAIAKQRLLQEFTGAALLGFATRFEASLFIPGTGSNGKSSFLRVVRALFPEGTVAAVRPHDFGNEYYRARLAGDDQRGLPPVRLNMVSETPEGELVDSNEFKAIVSGEQVQGRWPAGRPFDFTPIAAHWYAVQELPPTRDMSHGFWRRITVIAFNRTFATEEQDRYLADTIIDEELPGVAAWAVAGAQRLLARGHFPRVDSSESAKENWRAEANNVALFYQECCVWSPDSNELPKLDIETDIDEIYEHFKAWCRYTGHVRGVVTKHTLGRRLVQLGFTGRPSNGKRLYPIVVHNPPPTSEYI